MPRILAAALLLAIIHAVGCSTRSPHAGNPTGLLVACDPGVDTDRDGVGDVCETELARAFAPLLRVAPGACGDAATDLPPGGYLFGVRRIAADAMRIVYLPAYDVDCGWRGFKCRLGLTSCRGHSGDSELIALDVVRSDQHWHTARVFLSAHCFGSSDGNCRWYSGRALQLLSWMDTEHGAPVVWVAAGKQANYPAQAACDAGHWFYDTCDANAHAARFPVHPHRNIGSAAVPISADGCVTRAELVDPTPRLGDVGIARDSVTEECFWSEVPFTGWQRPARGSATPYVRYLRLLFEDPH